MSFERAAKTTVGFAIVASVINFVIGIAILGGLGYVAYHFLHKV